MAQFETIRFHNPKAFSGLTGLVDRSEAVIFGVSCITGELEAEGHSLYVDNTTLRQLHTLATKKGKVPVTLDHDGGIGDVNGFLHNFRMDGNKIRADWVLLKSHPETTVMLERAEVQPETFGLSFAFKGDPKGEVCNGKSCARAEALLSCDVVKRPAANKEGLFAARENKLTQAEIRKLNDILMSQKVDTSNNQQIDLMDQNPTQQNAEPTLADLMQVIQGLASKVEAMEQVQGQLVQHVNSGVEDDSGIDPNFLKALYEASDEELAAYNEQNGTDISREEINAAVAEYNQAVEQYNQEQDQQGEEGQQSPEGQGYEGQAGLEGAGAGAGAAAGGGASVGLSAVQRELIQLKNKINARELKEKNQAEAIQFEEVEQKIALIVQQRDELRVFAEKLVAQNEALELAVRTGTRPVMAGVDNGVRLFAANGNGELHPFQVRVKQLMAEKSCSEGKAILFARGEENGVAMHADWLQNQSNKSIIHS